MTKPSRARAAIPYLATLAGAATIAYGVPRGLELGSVNAPFWVAIDPRVDWSAAALVALFPAGLAAAAALRNPRLGPLAFAGGAVALGLFLRMGLNLSRGGAAALWAPFDSWLASADYLPALPAFRLGTTSFLDRFAELAPSLPVHPSAHPPGLLLFLHWTGIDGPGEMAALTIVGGALAIAVTYVAARELLEEPRARLAALFVAFSPASLLYGASSADALFATVALLPAAALLARGREVRAAGAPLVAVASFFSYALPGAAVWALLAGAGRRGWRSTAALALACGAAMAVFYVLLAAATGFDLIGTLRSAHTAYDAGIASARPYLFWLLGSPTAYFVALGLPLAWLAFRGAARGEPAALALLAVVAVAVVLGFTKAETERIWLFLVAPACIAAAAEVRGRVGWVLAALSVQAIAAQVLVDTGY